MTVLRTLAVGAAGGWLFSAMGMPLPWLTGPIAVTATLAIAGASVEIPSWFRPVIFIMLGLTIGSRVNGQLVSDLARWPLSLALLVLYVPAAIAIMYAYFRLVARVEPNTALVSSTPGSLGYVLAYAADSGADMRKVVITQSVRLGILVMLLPIAVTQAAPTPAPAALASFGTFDQIWLFAAAAAGGALMAWKTSIPAAPMLGALLVSAALHATGLNQAQLPDAAIMAAQVALGCLIGGRLQGVNRKELARVSVTGLGAHCRRQAAGHRIRPGPAGLRAGRHRGHGPDGDQPGSGSGLCRGPSYRQDHVDAPDDPADREIADSTGELTPNDNLLRGQQRATNDGRAGDGDGPSKVGGAEGDQQQCRDQRGGV
jgi:membrane AbrB-like protein